MKRITLVTGERVRFYCGCDTKNDKPYSEAFNKGYNVVDNVFFKGKKQPYCEKCGFYAWTKNKYFSKEFIENIQNIFTNSKFAYSFYEKNFLPVLKEMKEAYLKGDFSKLDGFCKLCSVTVKFNINCFGCPWEVFMGERCFNWLARQLRVSSNDYAMGLFSFKKILKNDKKLFKKRLVLLNEWIIVLENEKIFMDRFPRNFNIKN